jgi:hypothetical protein
MRTDESCLLSQEISWLIMDFWATPEKDSLIIILRIILSAVALFFISASGSPALAQGDGLDVNDVSLLLKPPKDRSNPDRLFNALTLVGASPLVPKQLFQEFIQAITSTEPIDGYSFDHERRPFSRFSLSGPGIERRSTVVPQNLSRPNGTPFDLANQEIWTLVAVRFDPCAPHTLVTGRACRPQIRLVLQPAPLLSAEDQYQPFAVADTSIHLLFDALQPEQSSPTQIAAAQQNLADVALGIKNKLLELGVNTLGRPLGVHPAYDKPETGAALDTLLREVLTRSLRDFRLGEIAFHGVTEKFRRSWSFFNAIVSEGQLYPAVAFFNERPALFERRFLSLSVTSDTPVSPQFTDGRFQAQDLYRVSDFGSNPKAYAEKMNRFDNPRLTAGLLDDQNAAQSVTCLACHAPAGVVFYAGEKFKDNFAELFRSQYFYNSVAEGQTATNIIEPKSLNVQGLQNFRNFGYVAEKSTVSLRALNESILVTEQLNKLLGRSASGMRCDVERYYACINDGQSSDAGRKQC